MVRDLTDKHSSYFESILQLRNCSEEVYDFVEKEMDSLGLRVGKSKRIKNGYDYFTSDNGLTRTLGKKLQKIFGGELVETATLHTQKKDKKLYRVTVLFREAGFKKSDLVEYQGDSYNVKTMGGKDILLQEVKTGKKVHVKYKDMKEIRKR
tara:strand:- start:812 stop:1264 length:453 start_codon:yes stop_codon:yes gene_type:complete